MKGYLERIDVSDRNDTEEGSEQIGNLGGEKDMEGKLNNAGNEMSSINTWIFDGLQDASLYASSDEVESNIKHISKTNDKASKRGNVKGEGLEINKLINNEIDNIYCNHLYNGSVRTLHSTIALVIDMYNLYNLTVDNTKSPSLTQAFGKTTPKPSQPPQFTENCSLPSSSFSSFSSLLTKTSAIK